MSNLKIGLVQSSQYWENKQANLIHFESLIHSLDQDTDILIFPEMFHTGFTMNAINMAEQMNGLGIKWLRSVAAEKNVAVVASLIIEEGSNYFNRMVFVEPEGTIHSYDKRKLFTLAKEDDHYSSGTKNTIVQFKGWKFLLQVCYDLRFPEIARNKVKEDKFDYDVLLYVANWPKKRATHWQTLLKARAIENQCYVVAVNRVGKDANDLAYSGNSALIDPLGEVITEVIDQEKVIYSFIEENRLKDIRAKLPFLKDQ